MESIKIFKLYNTDTFGSWSIGEISYPGNITFEEIFQIACQLRANIIVKPSRGKWYIKGTNNNKSFEDIENHIERNVSENYKPKSRTWLISYI